MSCENEKDIVLRNPEPVPRHKIRSAWEGFVIAIFQRYAQEWPEKWNCRFALLNGLWRNSRKSLERDLIKFEVFGFLLSLLPPLPPLEKYYVSLCNHSFEQSVTLEFRVELSETEIIIIHLNIKQILETLLWHVPGRSFLWQPPTIIILFHLMQTLEWFLCSFSNNEEMVENSLGLPAKMQLRY